MEACSFSAQWEVVVVWSGVFFLPVCEQWLGSLVVTT